MKRAFWEGLLEFIQNTPEDWPARGWHNVAIVLLFVAACVYLATRFVTWPFWRPIQWVWERWA